MKKFFGILFIILGVLANVLGLLSIIGGAGFASLVLIVPGMILLVPGIMMVSHSGKQNPPYIPNNTQYGGPGFQPGDTQYGQTGYQPNGTQYGGPGYQPGSTQYGQAGYQPNGTQYGGSGYQPGNTRYDAPGNPYRDAFEPGPTPGAIPYQPSAPNPAPATKYAYHTPDESVRYAYDAVTPEPKFQNPAATEAPIQNTTGTETPKPAIDFADSTTEGPFAINSEEDPFADTAEIDPFADTADARPFAETADVDPFADTVDVDPFGETDAIDPLAEKDSVASNGYHTPQPDMIRTMEAPQTQPNKMTYPTPMPNTVRHYESPQPVKRHDAPKKTAMRKTVLPEEAIHYRAAVHPEVMGARKEFVAIRIEPSGFCDDPMEAPRKAREIYAIRFVQGQVKEDFLLRINPEKPETNAQRDDSIPFRMTPNGQYVAPGFTPQPMITEVSERNAFQKLMNFLGDDVTDGKVCLVGHGVLAVDMPLLQVSLAKLGYHSRDMIHVIDVEDIARQILQLPDYSLPALARYYGIPAPDSAEAEKDPFLSGQVLLRMISIP